MSVHPTPSSATATLADLRGVLDGLDFGDVASAGELRDLLTQVEVIGRQATSLSIELLAASERRGLHYDDGHTSAKVMARHLNRLPGGEANARDRCRRMFAELDLIAAAYRSGSLGTGQVMLLGRIFANARVSGAMEGRQEWFLDLADRLSFPRFERRVLEWQRLIDEDGPEPAAERTARNRNASFVQNPFDLSWDLAGLFTSTDGAAMSELHAAYTQALFDADWAEARARVGDTVSIADLARTDAQRRADALRQIFADAEANENGMAPARSTHGIIWSECAYTEMARRFAGGAPRPFDVDTYRCETADGVRVDPTEAFADSVVNRIRRIVIDAKSVVIDLGHARKFTGLARDAAMLSGRECFWPGCWVPASRCESDHVHEHAHGGRTNPGNGAPACGRHNRWKQKGYRVCRNEAGQIQVHRPDGTVIT